MATITLKTNLPEVALRLTQKLEKLQDKEYLLRPVCIDLVDLMTRRIHMDGSAADGSPIGEYNRSYWLFRQRPPNNRNADRKIVVSLTRQLENDWAVIATKDGYGIGFKNKFNLQKARWVEAAKQKDIFSLTESEFRFAQERFQQLIGEALR